MDLYEAVFNRVSVRGFTGEEVGDEAVDRLLEAACRAPTAGNLQPWRFYVVRDERVKRRLEEAAWGQDFVGNAPVVVVFCADLDVCAHGYGSRGENLYSIQDTAAALENFLLAATSDGLGACWVGAFSEQAASAALGLPPGIRPLAIVPVGHPARTSSPTRREPVDKYTARI
ncbi:MAG: nitroreductase family protein [Actinomycetota bacterium]